MTPPISSSFVFLLLLLPAIGLLGRAIANALGCERKMRVVITPALALAPWLLTMHVIGRMTHSFPIGLGVGTSLVALLGIVVFIIQRKTTRHYDHGRPPSRWMWVGAVIAAAILAPTALGWHLHDELNATGHMSLAAQMLNGVYPPRHITFPHAEMNYHYGFDLLVATISALTRGRVDLVIDAIAVLFWGWSFCLAWVIGDRVTNSRGGIVASSLLFAGGIPGYCTKSEAPTVSEILGYCDIGGVWPNPPVASYFFQHPWTLGIPMALATVLIVSDRESRRVPRLCAVALLLAMLSLSQFTLFAALSASVVAQELFSAKLPPGRGLQRLLGGGFSLQRGGMLLFAVLVALFVASQLGGFFSRDTDRHGPTLVVQWGVTGKPNTTWQWMIGSFGFLLPLGLLGLCFVRRIRVLGFCLIAGSLLVINTVRIKETWDIVKFATVGAISLGMLSGVTIDRLFSWKIRFLGRPLAILLFCATTASGFAYLYFFGSNHKSVPSFFPRTTTPLSGADAAVADFLRPRIKPGELVYRARVMTLPYAYWAGLPQVWTEKHAKTFGFSVGRIQRRENLFKKLPAAPEYYLQENVRWFVLDSYYDAALLKHADAWIKNGRATEVMKSGRLRVVELLR